ncbi:hypothetical protein TKK_0010816 [Trichogramma kaykai]|uniref:Uncharacterized protein n=1 Tax=Trichogramma kaykai TaxID=54128 RepID=A0ABD2WVT2_9HYME
MMVNSLWFLLVAIIVSVNSQSHHFEDGKRLPGDKLLQSEYIYKHGSTFDIVAPMFEKKFVLTQPGFVITQILAKDRKINGKGAYVTKISGGGGKNFVMLTFKAQRGHGIKFDVSIFGRPKQNFIFGKRQNGDNLIVKKAFYKKPVANSVLIDREEINIGPNMEITQIKVLDRYNTGKNAQVRLVSGGVKYNHSTLNFESIIGKGINYNIEVYGKALPKPPSISHNLIVGERSEGDVLAISENVDHPAIVGGSLNFSRPFKVGEGYVITKIEALDSKTDGTGAYPRVQSGGLKQNSIDLRFKSKRGQGVYFTVRIYAKHRPTPTTTPLPVTLPREFQIGTRQTGDFMVYDVKVINATSEVKQVYAVGSTNMITYIKAVNQNLNSSNVVVSIISGGLGGSEVVLNFENLFEFGISYAVQIFALPKVH